MRSDHGVKGIDIEPGRIYNMTQAAWHSVIGTHNAGWLIVESNDTSATNSEYRRLTEKELAEIRGHYPDCLREKD